MPRQGLGMPIVSKTSNAPVTVIDDVLWEDFGGSGGEIAVNYQETRTNVVLHSQDTTDAEAWNKTNTAIDSALYEAPDNSTTANAIKSNSTGEKSYNITQSNLSVTAGKTYTASVHLKKDNLGFAKLRFNDGTVNYSATFNLTTGANVQAGNLIQTTNKTSVDTMDDGWFRCSMTFQAQNTTSSGILRVSPQADASTANPNIAVSGIVLIYVWGFQLEESIEATSYIVTTTEAKTATTTLNDTSDVWDFDGADLMPEADPDSEGVWEEGSNLVLNGDYEELGSELVTNGDFATDSNWTFAGTNGAVSNGVGVFADTTNSYIIQSSVVPASVKQYKLQYEVIESNGGGLNLAGGSSAFGGVNLTSSVGVHTKFITSNGTKTNLQFNNTGSFIGKIDNVSVKQVDPNDRWVSEADWTIEDGVAKGNGASGSSEELRQDGILTVGDTYEFTFTIQDYSSGSVELMNNGLGSLSSNGVHTGIGVAASTDLRFRGSSFNGSIDNVTVREYAVQPKDI